MDIEYKKYTDLDINHIYELWKDNTNIETLSNLKDIIEPYEFDIVTTSVEDLDFTKQLELCTLRNIIKEYHKKEIQLHYAGMNVRRYTQLWNYARGLSYGTDIDMGGGEYCQAVNVNDKKKYYSLIDKAYAEISPYEHFIKQDYETLQKKYVSEEEKFVFDLHDICQAYHKEIEFIKEELGIVQNANNHSSDKNENLLTGKLTTGETKFDTWELQTKYTKDFANLFNNIISFFYEITPKITTEENFQEQDETGFWHWKVEEVETVDTKGCLKFDPNKDMLPCSIDDFKEREKLFIDELSQNLSTHPNNVILSIIRCNFTISNTSDGRLIAPTLDMLVAKDYMNVALLLSEFIRCRDFITYLQQEEGIFTDSGINEYRKKIVAQKEGSLEALQERTGIYIHPINQTGEKHRNAIKENKIETSLTDSNMENMNTVDALIEKIDNELTILHDAPNVGEYKVFDFKTALSKLGAEMKKSECSEYHKEKISNLIIVFNDLCNTIIETTFYRDLSYDAESHIAKTEVIVSNTIKQNNTTTILEQEIPEELWKYYSQKSLPEQFSKTVSEICKYDYFKRKCKNDYSSFFPAVQYGFSGDLDTIDDLVDYIRVSGDLIQKGDRFEEFFNIDINFVWKHKTSFENYVYQLKKEKALMAGGEEKQTPQTQDKDANKTEKKERKQECITDYLSLDDNRKKEWLCQGMRCSTVKELAMFIAQSYTDKILCKIPSKKGGGLWNLAKAAFQIEDTATNRKTIENKFNLAYRPPIIPDKFK